MTLTRDQKTKRFVNELATTVPSADYRPRSGDGAPERRFRLSSIRDRCGYDRVSAALLAELTVQLEHLGIYASPPLKAGLSQDAWVTFSRQRPAIAEVAPAEAALEAFLLASPKSLKGLPSSAHIQHQVRVPGTNRRVDLIATTDDEVTIIELKKAGGALGVGQLVQYMDAWRKTTAADNKTVRGILLSGVNDEETRRAIEDARLAGHELAWYTYQLSFSMEAMK